MLGILTKSELDELDLPALEEHFVQNEHDETADNCINSFEAKIPQYNHCDVFYSCLRRCCFRNYPNVIEWLINKDPNVLIRSRTDTTSPLEIACSMGHETLTTSLLDHFKRKIFDDSKIIVDKIICEALCLSIKRLVDKDKTVQRENIFKKIFETTKSRKIDTEEYKDRFGHTALFYAQYENLREIELKLLETVCLTKKYDGVRIIDKIDCYILKQYLDNFMTVNPNLKQTCPAADEISINYQLLCPSPLLDESLAAVEINTNNGILFPSDSSSMNETEVIYKISRRSKFQKLLTHPVILCFLLMKSHISIYKIWFRLSMMFLVAEIFMFCGHMIYVNTSWFKIIFTVLQPFQVVLLAVSWWRKRTLNNTPSFKVPVPVSQPFQVVSLAVSWWNERTLDRIFMNVSFLAAIIIWSFDRGSSKLLLFTMNVMLIFKLVFFSRVYSSYGEMFKIVLFNFFKILMWYSFVVFLPLTCGYCFIFYNNEIQSTNITATNFTKSFFEVFTLSIGNIAETASTVTITTALVTFFLVFVISIAFFNLLTAQAVSDIRKLEKEADIIVIKEQIRFIHDTEGLFRDYFKVNIFKRNSRVIICSINCTTSSKIKLDEKIICSLNTFMNERGHNVSIHSGFLKEAESSPKVLSPSPKDVESYETDENGHLLS